MARRKKSRRASSKKIPILATMGVVASGMSIYQNVKDDHVNGIRTSMGLDDIGGWHADWAFKTVGPVVLGSVGSALASRFKLNRYLSKVPIFKL